MTGVDRSALQRGLKAGSYELPLPAFMMIAANNGGAG